MKKVFEVNEVCPACNGTGIYSGMAEGSGAGVVCSKCKGTGCYHFRHEYEEFERRKERHDIERVYKCNPGIKIGEGNGYKLEDFGGISYKEFMVGFDFPKGTEDRQHVCPKWWTQCIGERGPDWEACNENVGRRFCQCKYFQQKERCWECWDKEQQSRQSDRRKHDRK